MTARQLLDELSRCRAHVACEGGQVVVRAPHGTVP